MEEEINEIKVKVMQLARNDNIGRECKICMDILRFAWLCVVNNSRVSELPR